MICSVLDSIRRLLSCKGAYHVGIELKKMCRNECVLFKLRGVAANQRRKLLVRLKY